MKERGGVKRDVGNGAFLPHLLNSGPKGESEDHNPENTNVSQPAHLMVVK